MNDSASENQNELFTWVVKAGTNRLYYLNVKKDRNSDLYLVVKETKRLQDGSREVHRIMVFEKDLKKFVSGLKEVLHFISSQGLIQEESDSQDTKNIITEENNFSHVEDITQIDEFDNIRSEFEV
ncbi:MAG: DUF3276 family protein [bacterium]